jgi:hypothetical protein
VAVARISTRSDSDTLPCRSDFQGSVEVAKQILTELPETSPELLAQANIHPSDWALLLRATVEKMRGENAATIKDKQRFIDAVLGYCKQRGVIKSCEFIGSGAGRRRRQDYEVVLPDNTRVCVEAKGCGDGNNMNIWDRPSWADEFVVWSLCPESLAKDPGMGVWSAVSNRLMQKITVEQQRVEAFIFWDDRCGTPLRKCPKNFGVHGDLRSLATDLEGQAGAEDWIPPPCVYLFPKSWPTVPAYRKPKINTVSSCKFVQALLSAFNVPSEAADDYVHSAHVEAKGTESGMRIKVTTVSRCWLDGDERVRESTWKPVRES